MASTPIIKSLVLKSSLNLKAISNSTQIFTKGIEKASLSSRKIADSLGESNLVKKKLIANDAKFFRKRRDNVRRKENESIIEASGVTGALKRTGKVISDSTKGFFGRVLDFVGYTLTGWLVTKLPAIIKGANELMKNINGVVNFLSNFTNDLIGILTQTDFALDVEKDKLNTVDLMKTKGQLDKAKAETSRAFGLMEGQLTDGANQVNDAVDEINKENEDKKDEGFGEDTKNQWWDFLDLFPNKRDEQADTEESGEEERSRLQSEIIESAKKKEAEVKPQDQLIPNNKKDQQNTQEESNNEDDEDNEGSFEMYKLGGIIDGKSHEEGGKNINVEGGEAIIPKNSVDELGPDLINDLISGNSDNFKSVADEMKNLMAQNVESAKDGINNIQNDFDNLTTKKDKGNRGFLGWRSAADWMTGGLTDLDKKGNDFNLINPKKKDLKSRKLSTPRKRSVVYMLNNQGSSGSGGSSPPPTTTKSKKRTIFLTENFYKKIQASLYSYT
tara:strand:+ start:6493 stop:7995 length:1503 start_codon:yes stop_codon:yes gene_type:complete